MHLALLRPPSLPTKLPLRPLRRNASSPAPPSVVLAPRCGEAKDARRKKGSNRRRIDISAVIRPKDVRAIARVASSVAANLLLLALDGVSGAGSIERGLVSDASWGGGGWRKRPRRLHGIRGLAWLAASAAVGAVLGRESGASRALGSASAGLRGLVAKKGGVGVAVVLALALLFCVALAWSGHRNRRRRGFLKCKGWR